MSERKGITKEKESYSLAGTISIGLCSCDVYSLNREETVHILTEVAATQQTDQGELFTLRFEKSTRPDSGTSLACVFLCQGRQPRVAVNATDFFIEGPLEDSAFQSRLPHLFYCLTEKVRQEELNAVTIHAAAATREDKGLLILGDKGAGKTSTLLALVLGKGYRMIGNDLVLLQRKERLKLLAGSCQLDIREPVKKRFHLTSNFASSSIVPSGVAPYEQKTRFYPNDLGIEIATGATPLRMVVRVNLHPDNERLISSREIPLTTELLRLNENFARYIRGITTPVVLEDGRIGGYFPSLDTPGLCLRRNAMINEMLNTVPYYNIASSDPTEIAQQVDSLWQ